MIRFLQWLFRVKVKPVPQVGDWWEVVGLDDLQGTMCKITAINEGHIRMQCYTEDGLVSYPHRTDRKALERFYERRKPADGAARAQGEK